MKSIRHMVLGGILAAVAALGISTTAFAYPTAPAVPSGCVKINSSPSTWPNNTHSYNCGGQPSGDATKMLAPLQGILGTLPNAGSAIQSLSANANVANFYLMKNKAAYTAAFGSTYGTPADSAPGFTANASDTNNSPLFTVVFEYTGSAVKRVIVSSSVLR